MRRLSLYATALAAALLCLAMAVASASAAPRDFETSFNEGLEYPRPVSTDAAGNPLVGSIGSGNVSFFDSTGKVVRTETGDGQWPVGFGSGLESSELNLQTGELYVGANGGVYVFDSSGNFLRKPPLPANDFFNVTVDNSAGTSAGNSYAGVCCVPSLVYNFDPDGNPSNFSHSASYISGNKLTGTPSGNFSGIFGMTVDANGYLYVADGIGEEVDKFEPSGKFVKAFKGEGSPEGLGGPRKVAVDPTNGNVLINNFAAVLEFSETGTYLRTIGEKGPGNPFASVGGVATNAKGQLFVTDVIGHDVSRFAPIETVPAIAYEAVTGETHTGGTVNATIDPNGAGPITGCTLEYGTTLAYGSSAPCTPAPEYTVPTKVGATLSGLTTEQVYHYRFSVANAAGTHRGSDRIFVPHAVLGIQTEVATEVQSYPEATGKAPSAVLNGSWNGNNEATTYYFEWGETRFYGETTPVTGGSATTGLVKGSAAIENLDPIKTYHFRIVAQNGKGVSRGADRSFTTPPEYPHVESWVTDVHSDSADLQGNVNPGGGQTTYHFEYGTSPTYGSETAAVDIGKGTSFVHVHSIVTGLTQGSTYHYQVVATNSAGTTEGADRVFNTFPYLPEADDDCVNALARKQTGAALLFDCRAYELVSAADTAGYNVESNLIAGQRPYDGYPHATSPSRVLYTMTDGGIPNSGNPTNRGRDPYVATRGAEGWTTTYVGVPANTPGSLPFRSEATDASAALAAFAFSGADLCSPCFPDGSSGIPIRLPNGNLVQGMAGSVPSTSPVPAGYVARHFSADGSHFVFGSTTQLEPDGNSGSVSIYARNLNTGTTAVVSKKPDGSGTMTGAGIAALDISADGSRVLIGRLAGSDAKGNDLYHLYMNVGAQEQTIDLMPGSANGGIYAGMSAAGTEVYFTSRDALPGENDLGADLYRADVGTSASTLTRVSTGTGSGDTDLCAPVSNWNVPSGGPDCSVLAIAGGGGVAAGGDGAYFLSPEKLDGEGTAGQPNLFFARTGGAPVHVATLELTNPIVLHALNQADIHSWGDLQVTSSGEYGVFSSTLDLAPGVDNGGFDAVYRYAAGAGGPECVSCSVTGARPESDSALPSNGLGVTEDGRVFFDSGEALAPRDLNEKIDAYQWNGGALQLLSPGNSPYDSRLLSVSADGVDAYFFTRDNLALQDLNGRSMKIYDARSGGGFFVVPERLPCAASDECHGPSSVPAPPPNIGTFNGTGGQVKKKKKPKPKPNKKKKKGGKGKKGKNKPNKRGNRG